MPESFSYEAELELGEGGDSAAPGGAITQQLCGSWDHAGPCRWPHRTAVETRGNRLRVRVAFEAPPEEEAAVRELIAKALASGECTGPDGARTTWTVAGASSEAD